MERGRGTAKRTRERDVNSSKGRGSLAKGACAFPWAPCLYAPSSVKRGARRERGVYVPFQRIRVPPLVTPSRSVTARFSVHSAGHAPREILFDGLPHRSAPFFSRHLSSSRRFAVFVSFRVYTESRV